VTDAEKARPKFSLRELLKDWESDDLQRIIREIFIECDVDKTGYLSFGDAQLTQFLVKLFERHDLPPPELPMVVFRQMYNEVKTDSGKTDIDGLDLQECSAYGKRAHQMVFDFLPEMQKQKRDGRRSRLPTADNMASVVKH